MNQNTEKNIVLYYLNNLVKYPFEPDIEDEICAWFEKYSYWLTNRDVNENWERGRKFWKGGRVRVRPTSSDAEEQKIPRNLQTIRSWLKGKPGRLPHSPQAAAIMQAFHLAPNYLGLVTLFVHRGQCNAIENLVSSYRRCNGGGREISAAVLDLPYRLYTKLIVSSGEMQQKGLCTSGCNNTWDEPSDMFQEILLAQCKTPNAVKRIVLGKPKKATLKPERFEHIQEEYDWLKNLLANALTKKQCGVNVLIYGKPGTGKTEIAKTLCQEIGASLFAVSDNLSEEQESGGRRSNLAAALCILQGDTNSVLLMDEAEDVFGAQHQFSFFGGVMNQSGNSKSKLFFHKLLESNPVPVIWVCNSIRGVDPAHLRRFAYALDMKVPDESVQTQIWNYSARKRNVKLPKEQIATLVRKYDIEPAIIDTSLRTAALTGDLCAIEKTIDSLQSAMGRRRAGDCVADHPFSTALLNCDTDLERLTKRIATLDGVSFSLCLYGVPGSGKSAYARYLAEQLKMKVLHKRASDLIDMYVGQTEHNIAAAFAEAKHKKMLLVIDEADSFLRDRRFAHQNWEVTRVNEMLTQMESHPLPFVCTTNLMDDLDQASLRRFTFKVKYDFLTRKQVDEAFQHFFGVPSLVSLSGLTCLSPGDFAVVAKKSLICGASDHKELVAMLQQEQEVKGDRSNPIGFTMG